MLSDKDLKELIATYYETAEDGIPLWEYLGWTKDELRRWVATGKKPD